MRTLIAVATMALTAAAASAQRAPARIATPEPDGPSGPDALLVAPNGRTAPAGSVRFAGERVALGDALDREATLPLNRVGALMMLHAIASHATDEVGGESGLLVLHSGEAYGGELAGVDEARDVIRWRSALLGELEAPLSAVRAMALQPPGTFAGLTDIGARDVAGRVMDVAVLANGDQLAGFISLTPESLLVEVDTDAAPIELSLERVALVRLADSPSLPTEGPWAWLTDGSCLPVAGVEETDRRGAALRIVMRSGETFATPRSALLAITDRADRLAPARIRSVANADDAFAPRVSAPTGGWRGFASVGAADVALPGAGRVTLEAPDGRSVLVSGARTSGADARFVEARITLWSGGRLLNRVALARGRAGAALHGTKNAEQDAGYDVTLRAPASRPGPVAARLVGPVLVVADDE